MNLRACFEGSEKAKQLKQDLDDRKKSVAKELGELEGKIRHVEGLMRDLPGDGPLFQKYRQERALLLATFKTKEELGKVELQEFWQKARLQVYEQILQGVREAAEAKGLDLVLREDGVLEDQAAVLFRKSRFDLTEEVVAKLKKK